MAIIFLEQWQQLLQRKRILSTDNNPYICVHFQVFLISYSLSIFTFLTVICRDYVQLLKDNGPYIPIVSSLPKQCEVYDLSKKQNFVADGSWAIGKYDEVRPLIYSQEMFEDESKDISGFAGKRDLHIGLI